MSDATLAPSPYVSTTAPTLSKSAGNVPCLTQRPLQHDSGAQA